jgi:uncharacterized protein
MPDYLNGFQSHEDIELKPLAQSDRHLLSELCEIDPIRFLTPRLNIDHYGLESPSLRAWIACSSAGTPCGVLFRLNNTIIAADIDGRCAPAFTRLIEGESRIAGVRGTSEVVSGIHAGVRNYRPIAWEDSWYLRLSAPPACRPELIELARLAVPEDIEMLSELYGNAGSMYRSRANVAEKLATTTVVVVEEPALGRRPARIVSAGLLSPDGKDAGLIGGVYTNPVVRGRGYAAAVVAYLSLYLQQRDKTPVLFYENPVAGRVYRRLGFEEVGRWAVLYLGHADQGANG